MKKIVFLLAAALAACTPESAERPAPQPCDDTLFLPEPRKYILVFDLVENRQQAAEDLLKKQILPGLQHCFHIREQANGQYGIHPFELIVLPVTGNTLDAPPILRYAFDKEKFKGICYLKEGYKNESNNLQRLFAKGLKHASNPEQCFQTIVLLRRLAELVKGCDPENTHILLFSDLLEDVKGFSGAGRYSFTERRETKTVISPYGVEEAEADADGWIRDNIVAECAPLKGHVIRVLRPRWRDPELHPGTGRGYSQTVRPFWIKLADDIGCTITFGEAADCTNLKW